MKIILLGTGTSQGVPVIGCDCEVCSSTDSRDKRLRSSALITDGNTVIVIDTGPDFRTQMLRAGIRKLDGILFTHAHKDHTAGLDDIRPFYFKEKKAIDLFGNRATLEQVKQEFGYMFHEAKYPGVADVNLHFIDNEEFKIGGIKIQPLKVLHKNLEVLGFRFGSLAYITDANVIPDDTFDQLIGVKYLIINTLRKTSHPSHFTLQEGIDIAQKLKVEKAFLIHLSHQMGTYKQLAAELPENIRPGFDGLEIEF